MAPVLNIRDARYPAGPVPAGQMRAVQDAMVGAGTSLGWVMVPQSKGHILGTLNVRSHQAVVDIFFNTTGYNITYKASGNLKYNGSLIHRNYNNWVRNLDNRIRVRLAALGVSSGGGY